MATLPIKHSMGNIAIPRFFPIENTMNFELRSVNRFPLLEPPGCDKIFSNFPHGVASRVT